MIYNNKNDKNPYYDLEKTKQSLYLAANAGHTRAQAGLAQTLKYQVVEKAEKFRYDYSQPELKEYAGKKYKESCMWFEKAARQGYGYSMMDTARCYRNGYVTGQKDYIAAYAWFALAAGRFEVEEGDPYAPNSMAETFMKRTARRGKLTKEQIQQAIEIARRLRDEISGGKDDKKD